MAPGRRAVFRPKDKRTAVNGILTAVGRRFFEARRKELALLYCKITGRWLAISDADTIEFLARGVENTTTYLQQQQKA